jgi:glycosyltransferase involved in cell wall biosynthesis
MVGPFGLRPKGTMAVRALPLAKALVKRGHEVRLLLPPWSFPEDSGREWVEEGVRIENVDVALKWQIPFQLVEGARAFKSEILHFFKPKGYSGMAQWLAWQRRRVGAFDARIVLDEDDWEGAGGWNELEPYPWAYKKFFAWQEQWGLKHADAVTTASRALETIVWSVGVTRERVHYLPNGVNQLPASVETGEMIRKELHLENTPVILLYTRFFEYDLARVGRILGRVFENMPTAKLLIVGKGLFGEERKFLELASAQGWRERVVDAGWVEMSQLRAHLAAADVAIYPFDDTMVNRTKGIVKLMDLLGAGVPVVADRVGQINEYIRHEESGILIEGQDVDSFAFRILELLNDKEKRAAMGACAAETMTREYEWDKLAGRVERVYSGEIVL